MLCISDFTMILIFLLELAILTLLLYKTLKDNNACFDCVVIVFFMLFFYIAPIIQINSKILPNTMQVDTNLVIKSIILTNLFLLTYYVVRFHINFNVKLKDNKIKLWRITKIFLYIIFFLFLIPQLPKILNTVIGYGYVQNKITDSVRIKNLVIKECIFLIPLYILSYNIYLHKKKDNKFSFISCLIALILLILVKNFFIENRGTIAPIYLALLIYLFKDKLNSKKIVSLFILVFIIGYPVVEQIVHNNIKLTDFLNGSKSVAEIFNINYIQHFTKLDYDAWSNFLATIMYTNVYGFTCGRQILGSVLFFIPRFLWQTKPIATGETIGRFLMHNTSMWFYNLSNPIVSEGYIDFGIIGVIIYAIILAIVSRIIKNMISTDSYIAFVGIFISVQMFLFLRGDMLSSISFLVASIIGIYYIPLGVDSLFYRSFNSKLKN